jgi:hypothetical protein
MSDTHCPTCGGMRPGVTTNRGPFYACLCRGATRGAAPPRQSPAQWEAQAERQEFLRTTADYADAVCLLDERMRKAKINFLTRHMILCEWTRGFFSPVDEDSE